MAGATLNVISGKERASSNRTVSIGILADIERATVAIFNRASPAVVQIAALVKADDPSKFKINTGSGFFWDARGHVVTNAHVLENADEITLWLPSGERYDAELVGMTLNFDLAVIRPKGLQQVPAPIEVGRSSGLKVGQVAFAIGSPFGLDQSLSVGVISALKRQMPTRRGRSITNVIQTDAVVVRGSSGGPLLDSSGRLIGINTVSYTTAELASVFGFAIPVDVARRIIPQLIQIGRVPTPGIGIVPVSEEAAFRLKVDGVAIVRITSDSPAERAQLRTSDVTTGVVGDVIVSANGLPVRNVFDLTEQLDILGVGRTMAMTIKRDGKDVELKIEIIDIENRN